MEEINARSIFSPATGFIRRGGFDWSCNPYVGCSFGCTYCYAMFLPQNRRPKEDWGKWFQAKINAVEVARKQAHKVAGQAVYMSSVTDPYLPAERSLGLTRGILEELVPHQPRLLIQTRGPLVVRDIDVLNQFRAVRVNVSIPTDSEEVRRAFEPKAPPLERRWQAAAELKAAGLAVGLCALLCCGLGYLGIRAFLKPTTFPEQAEDYADARAKFHTKLLHQGPAPQGWQPEFPPPGVQEIQYVSGTLKLKAWVNQPAPAGPPKPAVLFLHCGFAFGVDDWDQTKPFRDAGFVTMLPTLRGENGLPGNYTMFYDEVDDVNAAADALAKIPGIDSKRLYVSGHSVGGTLTMLAAMTSTRFRAAASFSGSPDQVSFVRGQEEMAPFDQNDPREFQMRSPLAYPRSFKCPIRFYYGSQEFLFRSSTEKLAELAKASGADAEAVSVRGDHMTSVGPAMRQAITFFQQK